MSGEYHGRIPLVITAACALLAAAACQPGSDSNGNDGTAAGRQNVDAMSREHAGDQGSPSAGAGIAPERSVVAETLPYAEVDDELVYGHFVFPSDMVDPLPALIVIHEWWGLNDGVRAMADRLAGAGYIVLAVDLFSGKTADYSPDARQLMLEVVENPEPANENIRQAFSFLQETAGAPRIGALGWCFGGGWALNAGMLLHEELDALVIYYGQVTDDQAMLAPIDAPILGLFGEDDRGIPVDTVQSFEEALDAQGKNHEIIIYPDAGHAFANPSGNNYNAEVAQLAWEKTLAFLDFHLGLGSVATPGE
jgi:carboxymethylenebutenolidase